MFYINYFYLFHCLPIFTWFHGSMRLEAAAAPFGCPGGRVAEELQSPTQRCHPGKTMDGVTVMEN